MATGLVKGRQRNNRVFSSVTFDPGHVDRMATRREVCVFSPTGDYLAIAGLDGEVKVWECSSKNLKQRFNPSPVGGEIHALAWSRPAKEVCLVV